MNHNTLRLSYKVTVAGTKQKQKKLPTCGPLLMSIFCSVMLLGGCGASETSKPLVWDVENPTWDESAEREFSRFVAAIGAGREQKKCIKLGDCLQSPGVNPYFEPEDLEFDLFADCADLPMILRAYFAYKTKRPFSWVSAIHGDRYSQGNRPKYFYNQSKLSTLSGLFKTIGNSFHTGMFRMAPEVETSDTYPIIVSRDSLRPGTVYYDPNGHVLMVYKIDTDGKIHLIDGHPDNSLTFQVFSSKFRRGSAVTGGGFKNFRPQFVASDGRTLRRPNSEISDFSAADQYQKSYRAGRLSINYYEWIKYVMSGNSEVSYEPLKYVREKTFDICNQIGERIKSVEVATQAGIHLKAHPNFLPENIFGASGEWEVYSTPSRDARLKASFREAFRYIKKVHLLKSNEDPSVRYEGSLRRMLEDLADVVSEVTNSASCQFSYRNMDSQLVDIDFLTVARRIYDISFDPYHCPEYRWGAPQYSGEVVSCRQSSLKEDWYNAQYRLRNIIDRDMSVPTPVDYGPKKGERINYVDLIYDYLYE